jgi:hypothetical protein
MDIPNNVIKKYTIENILEMLCGYDYFDYNQVHYVFHKLNGDIEEANNYLELCQEKNNKMNIKLEKFENKIEDN